MISRLPINRAASATELDALPLQGLAEVQIAAVVVLKVVVVVVTV